MMHRSFAVRALQAAVLAALAACGTDRPADRGADSVPSAEANAPPLQAMPMLPALRAGIDSIAARPAMLRDGMGTHKAKVMSVMSAMQADLTARGMHSDAAYESLSDSVVSALNALPNVRAADLPGHTERYLDQLRRLASVYETMTAGSR